MYNIYNLIGVKIYTNLLLYNIVFMFEKIVTKFSELYFSLEKI